MRLCQGVTVDTVVNSGPGLVFITYPEAVLKLPGGSIWAIIFFVMLVVRSCLFQVTSVFPDSIWMAYLNKY